MTVNSFLATGGDGFGVLNDGTDRLGGAVDLDALEAYLIAAPGGVAPGPQDPHLTAMAGRHLARRGRAGRQGAVPDRPMRESRPRRC